MGRRGRAGRRGGRAAGLDLAALRAGFTDRLAGRLARSAARTLVLELNVARVAGQLTGDTPAERFGDFVRQTSGRPGLSRLFSEYVVLARLLAQTALQAGAATAELLGRFAADRAALVDGLLAGLDPGPLVEVDTGAGDGHRQGRTVSVLRFATGARVVYKPRPLAAHGHFNELARWLDARLDRPELRTLALLERPGYGWVEFVEQRPCGTPAQLERFYYRQGVLLALLHVLDATDVHHENLIACADDPVLVDLETLFHPAPVGPGTGPTDPAAEALESSVHRTGLLPGCAWATRAPGTCRGWAATRTRRCPSRASSSRRRAPTGCAWSGGPGSSRAPGTGRVWPGRTRTRRRSPNRCSRASGPATGRSPTTGTN